VGASKCHILENAKWTKTMSCTCLWFWRNFIWVLKIVLYKVPPLLRCSMSMPTHWFQIIPAYMCACYILDMSVFRTTMASVDTLVYKCWHEYDRW